MGTNHRDKTGPTLLVTYSELVAVLGEPDTSRPRYTLWSFAAPDGRRGFVWCYKEGNPRGCVRWSADGSASLLDELAAAVRDSRSDGAK